MYLSAEEAGMVEPIAQQLELVVQMYRQEDEFRSILAHPGVSQADKLDMIKGSFGESLSELMYSTVKLLIERGRLSLLPSLYDAYIEIADERSGRARATVYSAYELSDADKKAIESRFSKITGKKIIINNIIDETLIGGVRVRIGDRLYEGSIAGKLEQLRNILKQNA